MKRVISATAAVLATFAFVATAIAGGPKATGAASFTNGLHEDIQVEFNAQVDDKGAAKGQVKLNARRTSASPAVAGVQYTGDVTCYHQNGNTAWISGVIKKQSGPRADSSRRYFIWEVQDNGEPGKGTDKMTANRRATAPDCSAEEALALETITKGNIQVHQSHP